MHPAHFPFKKLDYVQTHIIFAAKVKLDQEPALDITLEEQLQKINENDLCTNQQRKQTE